MRYPIAALLLAGLGGVGCSHLEHEPTLHVEEHISTVAPIRAEPLLQPPSFTEKPLPLGDKPIDLAILWDLTLVNQPRLREASAEVEAAHGRLIQAGLYPNPRLSYRGDEIGINEAPKGIQIVELSQELLTAGKFQLDQAAAARGLDVAGVALLTRKFEVLTSVRREYYDYISLAYTLKTYNEVVASLEQSVDITRKLVETAKSRPKTDLLRLEALLEQVKAAQVRARITQDAAWKQLVIEVGVPDLARPKETVPPANTPELLEAAVRQRVQSSNTELRRIALEVDQARLEYERAQAEAVPNVTIGAGYVRSYVDGGAGANVTIETHLPLWDRKQGLILERRARWAQIEALQRTTAYRLEREVAEAFSRYEGARAQAERLSRDVLPKFEENLLLLREGYQKGVGVSFADVQLAIESLNDVRLRLAENNRELWRAVADLQGLMQLDVAEELLVK